MDFPNTISPSNFDRLFERYLQSDEALQKVLSDEQGLFFCSESKAHANTPSRIWIMDADDTLWEDNIHYEAIAKELSALILKINPESEVPQVRIVLDQVEQEIIPLHGFGPLGFRLSIEETFRRFISISYDSETQTFFDSIVPKLSAVPDSVPVPTTEVLEMLRKRGDGLVLFTQGPIRIQQQKIYNSKLASKFDALAVGEKKTLQCYKRVLSQLPWQAQSEVIVVGNSLKSEVLPAIELGLRAVHYVNPNSWSQVNNVEIEKKKYHTVHDLLELLEL